MNNIICKRKSIKFARLKYNNVILILFLSKKDLYRIFVPDSSIEKCLIRSWNPFYIIMFIIIICLPKSILYIK